MCYSIKKYTALVANGKGHSLQIAGNPGRLMKMLAFSSFFVYPCKAITKQFATGQRMVFP